MHEAGAAVVAAQLLAFYREPLRHRPRLTHGREPFSGGLLVFRFAQGRFPQAMMRELSAAKRDSVREAALFFIRQVCLWEGASHYQVLCVPAGARRETIKEHYHGLMALIHPDRQDPGAAPWPADYAQRVNKAYEVLSDDARRREYDAGLQKARVGSATLEESLMAAPQPSAGAFPKARGTRRARMRKPVLFISLAVSLLFFVQVWWAGEVPGEYSAIPSAAPFEMSLRWMREAYSGGQKSRPPASGETPAKRATEEEKPPGTSFLTPLWRALAGGTVEPRRPVVREAGAQVGASASVPIVPAAQRREELAAIDPAPARRTPAERAPSMRAPERVGQKAPQRAAGAASQAPASQAPADRDAAEGALTAVDMETMVAQVVTYYEAGDVNKLLGLYDAASVGLWEALNLRNDFEEFFRSTRTRRLRLQGVSWDTDSPTARVKGAARLVAEYNDETGRVERQVRLEMDIVSRGGQPRIARLSLFPHER